MKALLALILSFSITGCGTIHSIFVSGSGRNNFGIYSGVIRDEQLINSDSTHYASPYRHDTNDTTLKLRKLLIFDLPISFVLDTILLPFTITTYIVLAPTPQ